MRKQSHKGGPRDGMLKELNDMELTGDFTSESITHLFVDGNNLLFVNDMIR